MIKDNPYIFKHFSNKPQPQSSRYHKRKMTKPTPPSSHHNTPPPAHHTPPPPVVHHPSPPVVHTPPPPVVHHPAPHDKHHH
ncbi:hypothetical protein HanRHA438_Chr10g0474411 [Helianthus annuus]|uniref:Uncharacterized protein n=1 Tax=Helianthus annuus TaxID=4232 RepID=A0A9K3I1H6_HELAN|nr:hypothetical protein HanXRQr2_Chr10g0462051 [Helianthus annuus]KAJ0881447.1 hypothetical protein HanRHA438_Chr10g0474411 [Helianthus annuus]